MWKIKNPKTGKGLSTDIDSSGMDVWWTNIDGADSFDTKKEAEDFMKRVRERFPGAEMEVVEYA
jgi:hypothetical protein